MGLNAEILERATSLLATGQRNLLGIVAPPGAGKSTLAQELFQAFAQDVCVVPMDGFHLANTQLDKLGRAHRKGAPDTFDAAGYASLLARIRQQGTDEVIYAPEYRRDLGEAVAGAIAVQPSARLVITEGNYLLLQDGAWASVRSQLDAVWYLDIDDTLRRARLLERHMRFGRSGEEALAWIESTDEPNAMRIVQTRPFADWVVRLS